MGDADSNRVQILFPNTTNSLPVNFNGHYLVQREGIPLCAPRVHIFQKGDEFILVGWNNLMETSNLLPSLLRGFICSTPAKRDAFDNFVKTEKAIESAVAVHCLPIKTCVLTEVVS